MKKENIKLSWDGELIKEEYTLPDRKSTPKELLEGIDRTKSQIDQMKGQKKQLEANLIKIKKDIEGWTLALKDRLVFEEKCIQLQTEKLKNLINKISAKCIVQAKKEAEETIAKDPSAYTEDQKKTMSYVNYQRLLATHPDVANKISAKLISELLFEKPVFVNPFED